MTAAQTAVILAAGVGRRLGDIGRHQPKGLLDVGGERLMLRSVRQLRSAGIRRVVIVAGHRYQDYRAAFAGQAEVEIHVNTRYAQSGSMYSLFSVREAVTEDFLLLESDLLYESRALTSVLNHGSDDVCLTSGWTGSGDEVWVEIDQGALKGLSKDHRDLQHVDAELVGITRVSSRLFDVMCAAAEEHFCSSLHLDYEAALVIAARTVPVICEQIPDLVWTEVDDAMQLRRAVGEIVPLLQARQDWG